MPSLVMFVKLYDDGWGEDECLDIKSSDMYKDVPTYSRERKTEDELITIYLNPHRLPKMLLNT